MRTTVRPSRDQADNPHGPRGRCQRLASRVRTSSWPGGALELLHKKAEDTTAVATPSPLVFRLFSPTSGNDSSVLPVASRTVEADAASGSLEIALRFPRASTVLLRTCVLLDQKNGAPGIS